MVSRKWTREKLKYHLQYDWWKYVAVLVAAVGFWSLLFTFTEPEVPPEKALTVELVGEPSDQEKMTKLAKKAAEDFPEMEEITFQHIMIDGNNDANGYQMLYTYVFAGVGDVYLLSQKDFDNYALQAVFRPLDELIADGSLTPPEGADLTKTTLKTERDENLGEQAKVYGIPIANLTGLQEAADYPVADKVLVLLGASQNPDNAVRMAQWLLDNLEENPIKLTGPSAQP